MRLPLLDEAELQAELADTQRCLDRALFAVPVSADAEVRKRERVAGLRGWRDDLEAQLKEMQP